MKLKLDLFKVVPLITIAAGAIAPVEMANAASESHDTHPEEAKATTEGAAYQEQVPGNYGASVPISAKPAAADSHGAVAAADSHGEADSHGAAADSHGAVAAAGDHGSGDHDQPALSPKAQQLEFFAFLGAIGFSLIVPELLYRPKDERDQDTASWENKFTQPSQTQAQPPVQYDAQIVQQPVETNVTRAEFVANSRQRENLENSSRYSQARKDEQIRTFQTVEDDFEPYTVPDQKLSDFQKNIQFNLDNWSNPHQGAV